MVVLFFCNTMANRQVGADQVGTAVTSQCKVRCEEARRGEGREQRSGAVRYAKRGPTDRGETHGMNPPSKHSEVQSEHQLVDDKPGLNFLCLGGIPHV